MNSTMAKFRRLSERETFKSIELVQEYPPIHDITSDKYKDGVIIGNIYDKIAIQLEIKGITGKFKFYYHYIFIHSVNGCRIRHFKNVSKLIFPDVLLR